MKRLTVFSLGELEAAFGAATIDILWTDEVGAAFETKTDAATELVDLVGRLTDLNHGTVTLAFVPDRHTYCQYTVD